MQQTSLQLDLDLSRIRLGEFSQHCSIVYRNPKLPMIIHEAVQTKGNITNAVL